MCHRMCLLQHCYNYQCNRVLQAGPCMHNQLRYFENQHISVHNIPLCHPLNPLPGTRYKDTGSQQVPEQVLVLVQVQVLALEPVWMCCRKNCSRYWSYCYFHCLYFRCYCCYRKCCPLQACCHWLQYFYYRCQCFSLAYLPCHQKLRFLSLPEQLILRLQKPLLRYGCLSYSCCHCCRKNIIGSIHILHIKKAQKITHKKSR